MGKLKSKLLELYQNYSLANSFRRVARFWKDRLWQSSLAAAKEMGLKIQNTAQPNGATERRNLRDNRAYILFSCSTPQKPGARDQQWGCEGFVDERGVNETYEIGSVNGLVFFNKNARNNANGGNSSRGKLLDFSKNCGALSPRISPLPSNIQNTDSDKNADSLATLVGNFSVAQKTGARDEYCHCKDFVDERGVDETHEIGNVKGGFCSNATGRNSSQEKRLEFSKNCGVLSSRISLLSKLFRCKFLKSRAFTLIEIMVVVSVLGVLGMGLRNTIQKVLYDYEAYSALNFCKKIEKAQINACLIHNGSEDVVFDGVNAYIFLGIVWGVNELSKHATDMLLAENMKPFLPREMIKGKSDYVKFFQDPDVRKVLNISAEEEEEYYEAAKKYKGIQLNLVKGVNWFWLSDNVYEVEIDEKLVPFFEKQNFEVAVLDDGKCIVVKRMNGVTFYNHFL